MTISRRSLLQASGFALLPAAPVGWAQQFPSRPMHFIVPASPGTVLDLTARFMAEPLVQRLKATITVENKVGAGGIIATEYVAKAPPDGHTLLFSSSLHYTLRWTSEAPVQFDAVKDFTPVARFLTAPLILLVPANSPHRTLMDLVREMKSRPGGVAYSSAGSGSITHMCPVLLNHMTGTTAHHIPYKGAAGAVTDAAGGQVGFTCQSASVAMGLVKAGRLRALAVTGVQRLDALPEVPTAAQAGVAGYDLSSFVGVFVRSGTPAPIVQRLSENLVQIAATPEFKEFCIANSLSLSIANADTFRAEVPTEVERWKRMAELTKKD